MPLSFVATLATAPPKGSAKKGKALATTTVPQGTGPAKLRFKLAKLSTGFLSRRPDVRVADRRHRHHGRRPALPAQPPLRLAGALFKRSRCTTTSCA